MSKIGGGLVTSQEARPGEEVVWSQGANRMQGSRAVGGKLFLSNERILFSPNRIDALTGGKRWFAELKNVTEVGVEPKRSGRSARLGVGLRDRLRIVAGADDELFVVSKLEDEVLPRLRAAMDAQ